MLGECVFAFYRLVTSDYISAATEMSLGVGWKR
jgi:hypothetical protein